MNRRSIQSFQRHTSRPPPPSRRGRRPRTGPRPRSARARAPAARSAQAGGLRARRAGCAASGGPCRTANTPERGRGCPIIVAQSPVANTRASEIDCSDSFTAMKPAASTASQLAASPASGGRRSPRRSRRRHAIPVRCEDRARLDARHAARQMHLDFALGEDARRMRRTRRIVHGQQDVDIGHERHSPHRAPGLRAMRWCIASVVSIPAAPPPTTTARLSAPARARSMSASQARRKASTGFTPSACARRRESPRWPASNRRRARRNRTRASRRPRASPCRRLDRGRSRSRQETRPGEARDALEVDVRSRERVVPGDEPRQHPGVRRPPVGAHQHEFETRQQACGQSAAAPRRGCARRQGERCASSTRVLPVLFSPQGRQKRGAARYPAADPLQIIRTVHVPQRRQLPPAPADCPESGPLFRHHVRAAPADASEGVRPDPVRRDQHIAAVLGRAEHRVVAGGKRAPPLRAGIPASSRGSPHRSGPPGTPRRAPDACARRDHPCPAPSTRHRSARRIPQRRGASGPARSTTPPGRGARRRRFPARDRPAARGDAPRRAAPSAGMSRVFTANRERAPWRTRSRAWSGPDSRRARIHVLSAGDAGRSRPGAPATCRRSSAAAAATSARSCGSTPCYSQRRPEVVTRSRRQSGRRDALQRGAERDVFHQRDGGKPPTAANASRAHEDRLVAGGDPGQPRAHVHQRRRPRRSSGCRPSMRTSKRPQAQPLPASPSSTARRRAAGSRVSACRNSSDVARGRVARRRSSAARGRAARRPRGRPAAARGPRVPSALPPSTTIDLVPGRAQRLQGRRACDDAGGFVERRER